MDPAERLSAGKSPITFVVGIDFTETSEYALTVAERLVGSATHAALHLVHATTPAAVPMTIDLIPNLGSAVASALDTARTRLQALRADPGAGPTPRVPHFRFGEAAAELANVAREVGADLIV